MARTVCLIFALLTLVWAISPQAALAGGCEPPAVCGPGHTPSGARPELRPDFDNTPPESYDDQAEPQDLGNLNDPPQPDDGYPDGQAQPNDPATDGTWQDAQ
jgi:hypothetical protein